MTNEDLIIKDIGNKCADDVGAAIRRNMALADGQRGKMIVCTYAATVAIGAANGAFSAFMGGPQEIDETFVDQLWSDFLRPMVLGELAKESDP